MDGARFDSAGGWQAPPEPWTDLADDRLTAQKMAVAVRAATADRRRFEPHLAGCPHCMEYLAQIRSTIVITGQVTPDDLTEQCSLTSSTCTGGGRTTPMPGEALTCRIG